MHFRSRALCNVRQGADEHAEQHQRQEAQQRQQRDQERRTRHFEGVNAEGKELQPAHDADKDADGPDRSEIGVLQDGSLGFILDGQ